MNVFGSKPRESAGTLCRARLGRSCRLAFSVGRIVLRLAQPVQSRALPLHCRWAAPGDILPAMRSRVLAAVLIFAASSFAIAQNPADQNPPTAAEAQAFVDRANAELL